MMARRFAALAIAGAALVVGPLVSAPVASAGPVPYAVSRAPSHSALVSVVPADQAVLTSGPTEIVLTFNEEISPRFAQLALTRAGAVVALTSTTAAGPVLRATLADPGPGTYAIAYRVVSADGHPISGETRFTVTAPTQPPSTSGQPSSTGSLTAPTAVANPTPGPATEATPTAASSTGTPGQDGLIWLYVGGALVALAALTALWESRRKRG
jgi:methionine-rich copper-binding protein CopC